jgi:hypothetical protein
LSKDVKIGICHTIIYTCGSVWLRNLLSDIEEGSQTESVWEQGAKDDIWTKERRSDRRSEKAP